MGYGKIMSLRLFIRKAIQGLFFTLVSNKESHMGVPEILEILGSIINGFALPLKDEHSIFLEKALVPLHKVSYLSSFHQQLSYCMMQYAEKDPRLAEVLVQRLLLIWPCTQTTKEVLFLNEIEEVLEMMQPQDFAKVQVELFQRVALCIRSPHFQVSERALFLWNNDDIVKLINDSRQVLFPIVLGALYKNSQHHWNGTVHGLTYNVLKLLMEADPSLFEECTAHHRQQAELQQEQQTKRAQTWADLQEQFEKAPEKVKEQYSDRPRVWKT